MGKVHPHMLRHACGYALTNKGHDLRTNQDYLSHRDPKHTAIYTRTAAKRFEKSMALRSGAPAALILRLCRNYRFSFVVMVERTNFDESVGLKPVVTWSRRWRKNDH